MVCLILLVAVAYFIKSKIVAKREMARSLMELRSVHIRSLEYFGNLSYR